MMEKIKIATAQFENSSGDKKINLGIIKDLSAKAAQAGAQVIAFHECSVTGYSFARKLSREQLFDIAEFVPDGPSTQELIAIARENKIAVLAGLFEKDNAGNIYKPYVCVDENGLVAKYRKMHPFINPHLTAGDRYVVFDLLGWKDRKSTRLNSVTATS